MYKLTVVSGPNRGTSYVLQKGRNSIGRQDGNVIVLPSQRVSKTHCVLVVDNGEITVRDEGSSNGTFVNGILTKVKKIASGDKISVGEYVMEIRTPVVKNSLQAPAIADFGNVIQFPSQKTSGGPASAPPNAGGVGLGSGFEGMGQGIPTDPLGKAGWYFEKFVMPVFYGLNLRHEWRVICISLFTAFAFLNLFISVYPLLELNEVAVVKETGKRAAALAREIVEKNSAYIAANAETKTIIGNLENEDGVREAVLIDLRNRILAPSKKLNQYLTAAPEGVVAAKAAKRYTAGGAESGYVVRADDETVVAVEPLKVLDPQTGRNAIVAMAVVSIDTTLSTPSGGDVGMIYSKTLIALLAVGALIFFAVYRLTLKPLEILNDDIDKVLKGDMSQVTREFKRSELNQLWDVINSALQRVPHELGTGSDGAGGGGGAAAASLEAYLEGLKVLGASARSGVVVFDRDKAIAYINPFFEELSGIHSHEAVGQPITSVARDQALGVLFEDMLGQASASVGLTITEETEMAGINYKVSGVAVGMGTPAGFVFSVIRAEEEA
ncbi:MAG: FHA domain-containing protein [Bacteriovoracia bacterium]